MKSLVAKMKDGQENVRLTAIVVITWLACFIKPIIGKTYTSWDTHDLGFVNFLYFSDSLRDGCLPLWNHFIQSGVFFPSLFNIGIFSPFQLFFIGLSWIVNPVYVYELMLQSTVLVGGIGAYLLFLTMTKDRLIALFGATAFAVTVLVPITGQVMFLFSLGSFPWLIFACIKIMESRHSGLLRYVLWGALGAMYIASGYVWMNLINLTLAFIFSVFIVGKKYGRASSQDKAVVISNLVKLSVFFITIGLLYACLVLPGYLNMNAVYSMFGGDYMNPEPRLRSLGPQPHFAYGTLTQALVGAIDPRIVINNGPFFANLPKWSFGAGWVLWVLLLGVSTRKHWKWQAFWIGFLAITLLYSAGDSNFVGGLVENMPLLNANRWWFCGIFYSTIALVFLAVPKVLALKDRHVNEKVSSLQLALVGAALMFLLVHFKSSVFEFSLLAITLSLVWLLGRIKSRLAWKNVLTVLVMVNVAAIAYIPYSFPLPDRLLQTGGDNGYSQQILKREKSVLITDNDKRLGKADVYIFNDSQWYLQKVPFSHGYNPAGNPLYWYVKDNAFLKSLVVITQEVRKEKSFQREDFDSDDAFARALMNDVSTDMSIPTVEVEHFRTLPIIADFQWNLIDLNMTPNTVNMRVQSNSAAYLVFNNVNAEGWKVYVNGAESNLIKVNRLFQGVRLDLAGIYDVRFEFRPKLTIALLILPYIVLGLCLVLPLLPRLKGNMLK